MSRFDCKSFLSIRAAFDTQTLRVRLKHQYHPPYVDTRPSSEVEDFINTRLPSLTVTQIFQDLQEQHPRGWDMITRRQVHYLQKQKISSSWRRHDDSFLSTELLLSDSHIVSNAIYRHGNVQGIAFYITEALSLLKSSSRELVMDSTFGTNNLGISLYAVLAELDGTGVPIAYCFLGTILAESSAAVARRDPGATTAVLQDFLKSLAVADFDPKFFGTDKDFAQISAIQSVWPNTKVQLCYWHVRRALRQKLTSSRKTGNQNEYRPRDAQNLIPDLEICWASVPESRSDNTHRSVIFLHCVLPRH